jgi:hypothetical protein
VALGGDVVRDLDVATKPRDNEQFGDSVLGIGQLATELEVNLLGHRLSLIIEVRHDVFHGCSLVFFWKMIQKSNGHKGKFKNSKGVHMNASCDRSGTFSSSRAKVGDCRCQTFLRGAGT